MLSQSCLAFRGLALNAINREVALQSKYLYSFSRYINNAGYIFLFYCAKNIINSGNTILFGIEYFLEFTALFILLGNHQRRLSALVSHHAPACIISAA